jgi:hypothetical protein
VNDDIQAAIAAATKNVTKGWKQAKRQADRSDRVSATRLQRLRYAPPRITIREVAFDVMEKAYNLASSNGKYYANARQIMYAARPTILSRCDADEFDDVYFTQTLLKDYLEEYEPNWKVVWDARGHLVEPHTRESVSLGGIGVKNYMDKWHSTIALEAPAIASQIDTSGPGNRFRNVLFIEKEGFAEILTGAGIGTRYDMAIMSTKGLPVKAACDLVLALHEKNVRTFVLRDFDLAGFKIVRTLRNGTRLAYGSPVTDLGLRIADIQGLTSEPCYYRQRTDPSVYLRRQCDATAEEARFLVSGGGYGHTWHGQRVEINAMTSEQLIAWLERKFKAHGVQKLIPDDATLKEAFRRAVFLKRMQGRIEELEEELEQEELKIPARLGAQIRALLKKHPAMSWDDAAWQLADDVGGERT